MSDDIKITISGNDAQLVGVWQRQNAEILKNQKALIKMGEAGEKAGQKTGDAFNAAIGSAGRLIPAIAGVGTAVGAIVGLAGALKKEWDDLISRQREAASRQLTTADAQRKAIINLGVNPDPGLTREIMEKKVAEISARTGASQKDLYQTTSSALSARGNLSPDQMWQSIELAAKVAPGDAAAQQTMSGAVMDLTKKNKGTTPQENFGMMLALQGASRVKDLDQLAKNVVPAVIAGQGLGASAEEASEMAAAMSQALADPEGSISKTASTRFMEQIFDATSSKFGKEVGFKKRLEFVQSEEGAQIRKRLMGDPRKRAKGQHTPGELEGEVQALPAMRGFLDPNSVEAGLLKEAQRAIPDAAAAGKEVPGFLKRLDASPLQQQGQWERHFEQEADSAFLEDIMSGRTDIVRRGIDKALKANGEWWGSRSMTEFDFDVNTGIGGAEPTAEAQRLFRREAGKLRSHEGKGELPPEVAAKADRFDKIADGIERLVRLQEEANKQEVKIEVKVDPDNQKAQAGPAAGNERRNLQH